MIFFAIALVSGGPNPTPQVALYPTGGFFYFQSFGTGSMANWHVSKHPNVTGV
jgi:hypothetical protein